MGRSPSLGAVWLVLLLCGGLTLLGPVSESRAAMRLSSLSLAGVVQHDQTLGSPRAPIELAYFDDVQCRFCRQWHTAVFPTLVRRYVRTGELQIQWHGYAVIGPDSVAGERFVLAAGLQNHLWDVLGDVFASQGEENGGWLTPVLLEAIGGAIPGFNVPQAVADSESQAIARKVRADDAYGRRVNLTGTPWFLLGRRGHTLHSLVVESLTPREFTRPIAKLLRGTGAPKSKK
jgi:protein-disulfide isomerase